MNIRKFTKPINHLKAIVICHGKSEVQMCQYIRANLRLPMEVVGEKNGEKSIEITSIGKFLQRREYCSIFSFQQKFPTVEIVKGKFAHYFKIFIILDEDNFSQQKLNEFITKQLFINHWMYEHIVPIYNIQNLESVLQTAGIKFTKVGKNMKKEYIKIFPTDPKYMKTDSIQIEDFQKSLEKCNNSYEAKTNMHEFINFCLQHA